MEAKETRSGEGGLTEDESGLHGHLDGLVVGALEPLVGAGGRRRRRRVRVQVALVLVALARHDHRDGLAQAADRVQLRTQFILPFTKENTNDTPTTYGWIETSAEKRKEGRKKKRGAWRPTL